MPNKHISIYIDADACPVKAEVYRVAERHLLKGVALKVFVVSNAPINVQRGGDDRARYSPLRWRKRASAISDCNFLSTTI